jgi:tRNA threonylcarbamoyladenosine biosynthesis protein TsaB
MKTLALEFSSAVRSVAVADSARVLAQVEDAGRRDMRAFAAIEAALKQGGAARDEISRIAVGLGPGSYAGIRIAIAIAQGWQLARGVALVGVPSSDCIAAQAQEAGLRGRTHFVFDAHGGDLYVVTYALEETRAELAVPFRRWAQFESEPRSATEQVLPLESEAASSFVPPRAATLARLAAQRPETAPGFALEPVYLRKAEFVKALPPRFSGV